MKILVVLPNFEGGGAERIHVNLANEWAKSGHEVIFCVLEKKGPLIDLIDQKIKVIDLDCKRILFSLNPLIKTIRAIKPQKIVAANVASNYSHNFSEVTFRLTIEDFSCRALCI